jgi:hypothetical protein
MIQARSCPQCGAVVRQIVRAWEALPVVQCALCGTKYALPSWGLMTANIDPAGVVRLAQAKPWEPVPAFIVPEHDTRSFWERVRAAWRGLLAGWRGER